MSAVQCRALESHEIELILGHLEYDRDRTLFILGLSTGFRIAELLSIKVSDVTQYGVARTSVTVAKSKMKGAKSSRTVPLNETARNAIILLVTDYKLEPNDYLFKSRNGGAVTQGQIRRRLSDAFKALRLLGPLSTHSMRKTFAQRVYEASGRDLPRTQRALGHVSIDSTVKYLGIDQKADESLILNLKVV
jgi:integrase